MAKAKIKTKIKFLKLQFFNIWELKANSELSCMQQSANAR